MLIEGDNSFPAIVTNALTRSPILEILLEFPGARVLRLSVMSGLSRRGTEDLQVKRIVSLSLHPTAAVESLCLVPSAASILVGIERETESHVLVLG